MKVLFAVFVLIGSAIAAPSPRIIGGEDAEKGEFPYQVSYQWRLSSWFSWQHVCGGTIISENWILTAGHCVTEIPSVGKFRIVAGILNLSETDGQTINVVDKIVNENYKGGVAANDIALLKLESPLSLNDLVQSVKLPEKSLEAQGDATLTGWGAIFDIIIPIMPNKLQKAVLPIVSNDDCHKALDALGENPFDAASNMCSGPLTGGKSACSGDSGGPIAQNGTIIGVVSWGISPCGTKGAPSVYTKVSNFVDWINEKAV